MTSRPRADVLVLAPSFPPAFRGGGPARSLDAVVSTAHGYRVAVVAPDTDLGTDAPLGVPRNTWTGRDGALVRYTSVRRLPALARALLAARAMRPRVLYLNSFFDPVHTILPLLLWRVGFWGRPTRLLAPRGEFAAAALAQRGAKKRLYLRVFRLLRMQRGMVWHATAPHEVDDVRTLWGEEARVVLRENETRLPPDALPVAREPGPLRTAFLSRLSPLKGLDVALRALRDVPDPVVLDVYGPEEDAEYVVRCRALAADLPEHVDVTFRGPLAHEDVRATLARHDALLLPTAGENFGHVVAEALSASCVVMTTPTTPWTARLLAGGGVVVADREPTSWSAALRDLAAASDAEVRAARASAGDAYRAWRAEPSRPHLFALVAHGAGGSARAHA